MKPSSYSPREIALAAIKARGLTQAQFAEQLGTSQPNLSRALKTSLIPPNTLWSKMLDMLDLDVTVQFQPRPLVLIPEAQRDIAVVLDAFDQAGYETAQIRYDLENETPYLYVGLQKLQDSIDHTSQAWARVPRPVQHLFARLVLYVRRQWQGQPAPYEPSGGEKLQQAEQQRI